MGCEAEIIVSADLDVAGERQAALERVAPLPELDFSAYVVIVDAIADEARLAWSFRFAPFFNYPPFTNSKQH
jgi:hypothetical protein